MKFSSKVLKCGLSPMRKFHPYAVAAEAKGRKIYHLNIGQPDIETPKAYFDAVKHFDLPVLAYAPSPGIPELIEAGIDSLKIEGRMKTALYVATVARTYRKAIDDYKESEEKYRANMEWYKEEIAKCTYREFTTGFYYGRPTKDDHIYDSNTYVTGSVYLGTIRESDAEGWSYLEQKNKFSVGEQLEIMKPDGRDLPITVLERCGSVQLRRPAISSERKALRSRRLTNAYGRNLHRTGGRGPAVCDRDRHDSWTDQLSMVLAAVCSGPVSYVCTGTLCP